MSSEAPLPALVVQLPFPTKEEFLRRHGANLTAGGLYVRSKTVKPPGSSAVIDVRLQGGERLIYAQVHVDFVTGQDGKGKSGMGLRFTHVDEPTQRFLDKVAASYLHARTHRPPLPPSAGRVDRAPEPEPPPAPVAPPPGPTPEPTVVPAEAAPVAESAQPPAESVLVAGTPDMKDAPSVTLQAESQEPGAAGVKGFFKKLFGG